MKYTPPSDTMIIYTIGHSNVEMGKFITLLQQNGITLLVDVRSEPYSKYADWFNKYPLERALKTEDIDYLFLGQELGGRPDDPSVYLNNEEVDYDAVRKAPYFRKGIDSLLKVAAEQPVAIMCSEEDPLKCHRSLLIASALDAHGVEVIHIRHDGALTKENELRPQMKLPW
jgi:uncharacterized protein (DUF488 family)